MTIKQFLTTATRMVLTAYCFAQFAVQVLWLGKWQMPRIMASHKDSPDARRKALYAAHRHVVHYLNTLDTLGLVEFRIEGSPCEQPCVLVANHPSLLDFIVLLRDLPNAVCLYKAESLQNPVLSAFIQVGGYIEGIDGSSRAAKRIIASCCQRLSEGHHVVFFPEGTRSKSASTLRKFRTTAFHAAVKCDAAVQPVVIDCEPLFLGKNQRWTEFSRQRNIMTIRYLPAIRLADLPEAQQNANGLAQAARERILQALAAATADTSPE